MVKRKGIAIDGISTLLECLNVLPVSTKDCLLPPGDFNGLGGT